MARVEAGRAAEGKTISSLLVKKLTFGNGKPSKALREISDVEFKWSFLFSKDQACCCVITSLELSP